MKAYMTLLVMLFVLIISGCSTNRSSTRGGPALQEKILSLDDCDIDIRPYGKTGKIDIQYKFTDKSEPLTLTITVKGQVATGDVKLLNTTGYLIHDFANNDVCTVLIDWQDENTTAKVTYTKPGNVKAYEDVIGLIYYDNRPRVSPHLKDMPPDPKEPNWGRLGIIGDFHGSQVVPQLKYKYTYESYP